MNRTHVRRVVAFAFLALIALAPSAARSASASALRYGGWGGYGAAVYGGVYGGDVPRARRAARCRAEGGPMAGPQRPESSTAPSRSG